MPRYPGQLSKATSGLSHGEIARLEGDRQFESPSLRRPVCLTSAFHAYRRKDPAFAGSVSLDGTRERDVLARSRLALAPFSDGH